jgi:hypothetical protein
MYITFDDMLSPGVPRFKKYLETRALLEIFD